MGTLTFETSTRGGVPVTIEAEYQPEERAQGIPGGWLVVSVLYAEAIVVYRADIEAYLPGELDHLDDEANAYARMRADLWAESHA